MRFKQLDFGLSYLEECCAHFLVGYFFDGKTLKAKDVFVEGDSLVQRGNGYAYMFNVGDVHFVVYMVYDNCCRNVAGR